MGAPLSVLGIILALIPTRSFLLDILVSGAITIPLVHVAINHAVAGFLIGLIVARAGSRWRAWDSRGRGAFWARAILPGQLTVPFLMVGDAGWRKNPGDLEVRAGATPGGWKEPKHTKPATQPAAARTSANPFQQGPQDRQVRQGATLSEERREQLILEHLPQVRLIARRIHERLPECVSLDDLISTGTVGLISAIDRFDPALNVKLKTYAEYKIRGAILDSLRGLDWAPRQQRKRSKQIEAAISKAEQLLYRAPDEEEIAAQLGLSIEVYHEWLVEIRGLNLGSLENATPDEEDNRDLLQYISDDEEAWPSRLLERSELQKLLAEAIAKMTSTEQTVLSLYYYEELTLREISKIVHLHESRISQIKSQAILRLRSYIERRWPCPRGL